jgi:uncharacterized protein (TIGR02284 family)
MDNTKSIDLFNTLVVINQERMTGYETAEKETESEELKALFSQCKYISQQNKSELSKEIYKLGGIPDEDTKMTGNFYRIWMDIKSALTGRDRQTILESCDYGEKVAADTYKEVLNSSVDEISNEQRTMLNHQLTLLNGNHYTIKGLIKIVLEEINS